MRRWSSHLAATGAIFERDLQIFISYRLQALSQIVGTLLTVGIFYYVSRLIDAESFASPDQYFAFVVTGLLVAFVLYSALLLPVSLRQELVAGTFERLLVSPFGAVAAILSMLLFPIAFALGVSVVCFVVVAAFADLSVQWSSAPAAIPVALLGALAFSGIAVLVAALTVVFKQSPGVGLVLALIGLTGGIYFPVELLPGWLSWISEVQPFTPTIDLLRHLLIGTDTDASATTALLKLGGFAVVLVPAGVMALRAAVHHAQRRGTILEY